MKFFQSLWKGVKDVYEQFVYFVLVSFAFFLCVIPAIVGFFLFQLHPLLIPVALFTTALIPPGLVTLFALTDPRRIVRRPEFRESLDLFGSTFKRSWKIGIVTLPVLVILAWNIIFFYGTPNWLAVFVPLWLIMLISLTALTMYMFSLAGTMESGLANAFRGGMYVLVSRPFQSLAWGLFTIIFTVLGTISVLPMITIGPSFLAAVTNRMVFEALQVYVMDPNAPTNEREWERERGINLEKSMWDRIRSRAGRE